MANAFRVTITTSLNVEHIYDNRKFPHHCVIDLRRCENGRAFPIEETVLRRLKNFRVGLDQSPTDLLGATSRQENELYRTITENGHNVLVVTDQPAAVARFCQQLDIPFVSRELYLVEEPHEYLDAATYNPATSAARFGSLAC